MSFGLGKYARILEGSSQVDWGLKFRYSSACEFYIFFSPFLSLIEKFITLMPVGSGSLWAVRTRPALACERSGAWHAYEQIRRVDGPNSAVT